MTIAAQPVESSDFALTMLFTNSIFISFYLIG
jgi:hypothetical protein